MKDGNRGIKILKEIIMKKFLAFIVVSLAMAACYQDYITDYIYSGVYFPYQTDVRTFVVGEGMKIEVGVTLGGVTENTKDRNVSFAFDGTLITPERLAIFKTAANSYIKDPVATVTSFLQLPSNYYSISSTNVMVIKAGKHMGSVVIRPDSARFLGDPATKMATYVLPFMITAADADTILQPKRYAVIGLRYDNMLFGKYWHGGSALVNRPAKSDTTLNYYTVVPMPEPKIWNLTTNSPNSLNAPGFLDQVTGKSEMVLSLSGNDITVSSSPTSTYVISQDGPSVFNRPKLLQDRKIFLKYKYTNPVNGWTYHCTDTLTFRNRIRDGINEWQDENPANYK